MQWFNTYRYRTLSCVWMTNDSTADPGLITCGSTVSNHDFHPRCSAEKTQSNTEPRSGTSGAIFLNCWTPSILPWMSNLMCVLNTGREAVTQTAPRAQMQQKMQRPSMVVMMFFFAVASLSGVFFKCGNSTASFKCDKSISMKLCTRFGSCVGETSWHSSRMKWSKCLRSHPVMFRTSAISSSSNELGKPPNKYLSINGSTPIRWGSKYTMPLREIVAGEASATSCGSMIVRMFGDIAMISPLFRQSFLFSSMTVFMFSIHTASIGPSNNNHFRSSVWFRPKSRKRTATIPSDHS
mmetsp:Transcript_24989/g.71815  ORF Transcript_24989/g.71815 Transcript_24989/m.71815 type:complete len:295 (-) Transcript_24989:521-1405(-)